MVSHQSQESEVGHRQAKSAFLVGVMLFASSMPALASSRGLDRARLAISGEYADQPGPPRAVINIGNVPIAQIDVHYRVVSGLEDVTFVQTLAGGQSETVNLAIVLPEEVSGPADLSVHLVASDLNGRRAGRFKLPTIQVDAQGAIVTPGPVLENALMAAIPDDDGDIEVSTGGQVALGANLPRAKRDRAELARDYDRDDDDDDDDDGVPDVLDSCSPTTQNGEVVDNTGCSVADLTPCDEDWASHGAYVSGVASTAREFAEAGLISEAEVAALVTVAAGSSCGR